MSANVTHNNGKDCSSVMLRQLIPAFIFLTLFHPPPRLPSLLCQLLWGGLEGMLMASCPHTPRPHMPLVGMWLFTTKAYWNFTPPMLWVFFSSFSPPPTPPHRWKPSLSCSLVHFALASVFFLLFLLSCCCLLLPLLFKSVSLACSHGRNDVAWLASSMNEALWVHHSC